MKFYQWLRKEMQAGKWTQIALAKATVVSVSYLNMMVKGKRIPSIYVMRRLMVALKAKRDCLLDARIQFCLRHEDDDRCPNNPE